MDMLSCRSACISSAACAFVLASALSSRVHNVIRDVPRIHTCRVADGSPQSVQKQTNKYIYIYIYIYYIVGSPLESAAGRVQTARQHSKTLHRRNVFAQACSESLLRRAPSPLGARNHCSSLLFGASERRLSARKYGSV